MVWDLQFMWQEALLHWKLNTRAVGDVIGMDLFRSASPE
jgi:hypothetical protein